MVKFKINAESLPVFHNCLSNLHKISSEVSIEFTPYAIRLSSINSSRSCFAAVSIKSLWFSEYFCAQESVKIRILIKPLLHISKTYDSLDYVQLQLLPNDDYINVTCKYQERLIRKHMLHYEQLNEILNAKHDQELYEDAGNCWSINPKGLLSWMGYFGSGLEEVSMRMKDQKVSFVSFIDQNGVTDKKSLVTELTLEESDFVRFQQMNNELITFSLKEFKTALTLCDSFQGNVNCNYVRAGMPIIFRFDIQQFLSAEFVLATYSEESDEDAQDENNSAIQKKDHQIQQNPDQSFLEDPSFMALTKTNTGAVINKREVDELLGGLDAESLTKLDEEDEDSYDFEEYPATPTKPSNSLLFD